MECGLHVVKVVLDVHKVANLLPVFGVEVVEKPYLLVHRVVRLQGHVERVRKYRVMSRDDPVGVL